MLAMFADDKAHSFFEIMKLTSVMTKKKDRVIWSKFKDKLLFNGWIKRLWKSNYPHTDFYRLTTKGDNLFRSIQIANARRAGGNSDTERHFKYFDRNPTKGRMGVNVEDNITEQAADLQEKYPELYGRSR